MTNTKYARHSTFVKSFKTSKFLPEWHGGCDIYKTSQ